MIFTVIDLIWAIVNDLVEGIWRILTIENLYGYFFCCMVTGLGKSIRKMYDSERVALYKTYRQIKEKL